jgi:predicted MFS family arabinose efflux permease
MPGTRPGMTMILKSARSANAALRGWQDTIATARLCNRGPICHNSVPLEIPVTASSMPAQPAHPARLILILSLAPVIGLGIGRFAYSLVLPDMRETLGWSYSVAGFMNTVNAAGYLAGALVAARLIRRFGLAASIRWGTLACVLSLALSAISGNLVVLSLARVLVGIGAALAFVASAALAARIAQSHPTRASFLLSLFYAGPGFGILTSGLIAPFMLQILGRGSWWIVWWAMTLLTAALIVPLLAAPIDSESGVNDTAPARFPIRPILIYLAGYFLFGAGYIAYMTFMIAYIREAGGGAAAQSAFWCLIGLSAFVTPWAWQGLLARDNGGLSTAIILGVNTIGAALPLLGHSVLLLTVSALVFGVSFFAIVGSTTAFVRFNSPPSAWPKGIAAMTIAFGIGQTLGPTAVGAITDAFGDLSYALNASALMLALGALATAFQRRLARSG